MHDAPKFFIHQKADEDLESIFDFSVETFGFVRAVRYVKDIGAMFIHLASNPNMGKSFDELLPNCLHKRIESHFIYYEECDGGIEIYRVLHKRMLPNKRLIDLL